MLHAPYGQALAQRDALRANNYPGRLIVLGLDEVGLHVVQIAAMMGRSDSSRNRVYVEKGNLIKTEVADPAKPSGDPKTTIYTAMAQAHKHFVVTNGHQTDTVLAALMRGKTFEEGLENWESEPDDSHTPRISASYSDANERWRMAIHRRSAKGNEEFRAWDMHNQMFRGIGWCLQTYAENGNPLPSYRGEPYPLPLEGNIEEVAQSVWALLNEENRVGLVVKFIARAGGHSTVRIINHT